MKPCCGRDGQSHLQGCRDVPCACQLDHWAVPSFDTKPLQELLIYPLLSAIRKLEQLPKACSEIIPFATSLSAGSTIILILISRLNRAANSVPLISKHCASSHQFGMSEICPEPDINSVPGVLLLR